MPNVLVRKVPPEVLQALKARASAHRRSLQQELAAVLEEVAHPRPSRSPAEIAAAIRERLARSGRTFGDSAALVREDRTR